MSELAEEMLLDFLNAVEAGVESAKQRYIKQKEINPETPSWDPSKIKWQQAQGTSGPYEKAEDMDSPDLKQLAKDLAGNGNKLSKDGYFYWLFKDSSTIGRKKRI